MADAKHTPEVAHTIACVDSWARDKELPTWSELLAALEAEQEWRGREAVGELDPEWDYEVMVGAKRRAAIAKATGGAQ